MINKSGSLTLTDLLQKRYPGTDLLALPKEHQPQLRDAFHIAKALYADCKTIVGLHCLQHGLCVADTLIDLNMDIDTICAGLLNHVFDSDGLRQIEKTCGVTVVMRLSGLRQLDIYTTKAHSESSRTLEAIRRAALSVIDGDVRVVMIRLAMALHTLRAAGNVEQVTAETRQLIATDVRNIYAPLANRLGIWQLKWELEDRSFRYLEPKRYYDIANALAGNRDARNSRVQRAIRILRTKLNERGIIAEVSGRAKHIYSIHRKMVRKNAGRVSDILDMEALRIIIERDEPEAPKLTEDERKHKSYAQCYRTLGIIHNLWEPIIEEFDDYVQHPKPNGYRSLHTAVLDNSGEVLEVQIRTKIMHQEAEQGIAAHWAYKEGSKPNANILRQVEAMRSLLDLTQAETKQDEIPTERIFVFTPNDDVIDLEMGSTPLDFAYAIHTMVGHRTRGALVNGKMVPLSHQLKSGDQIKIVTFGKKDSEWVIGRPNREWMNLSAGYIKTNRAKSRIRKWFRDHEEAQNAEQGTAIVERLLKENKLYGKVTIESISAELGADTPIVFLTDVAFGLINAAQIEGAAIRIAQREFGAPAIEEEDDGLTTTPRDSLSGKQKGLTVMGMAGLHLTIANCCKPIPPEPIVGYITRGSGIKIHHENCKQIKAKQKQPSEAGRIIEEVDWPEDERNTYEIPYHLRAERTTGLVEKIATLIRGTTINLVKTKTTNTKKHTNVFILAEVADMDQAMWLENKLSGLDRVLDVRSR